MYVVRTIVRESRIEGNGRFADQAIPTGTIVYLYGHGEDFVPVERVGCDRETVMRCGIQNEAGEWLVTDDPINHACNSNLMPVFVDGIYFDVAVRDIEAGEEILLDYRMLYSSFERNEPCRCHTKGCARHILGGVNPTMDVPGKWFLNLSQAVKRIFDVPQPLFESEDPNAIRLTAALKALREPHLFRYVKHTLVSSKSPFGP